MHGFHSQWIFLKTFSMTDLIWQVPKKFVRTKSFNGNIGQVKTVLNSTQFQFSRFYPIILLIILVMSSPLTTAFIPLKTKWTFTISNAFAYAKFHYCFFSFQSKSPLIFLLQQQLSHVWPIVRKFHYLPLATSHASDKKTLQYRWPRWMWNRISAIIRMQVNADKSSVTALFRIELFSSCLLAHSFQREFVFMSFLFAESFIYLLFFFALR